MTRFLLLSLLLLTGMVGHGQDTAVVDLPREGVNFLNGNKTLTEIYGTVTKAKAECKYLFGWAAYKGMTDAEVMTFLFAEGKAHNGFWEGENGNYSSTTPSHAWKFKWGSGTYDATGTLPCASGVWQGHSSRAHDQNGTHSYGGTTIRRSNNWKTKWFPDEVLLRSANWGASGDGGWVHHISIQDINFHGARRFNYLKNDGTFRALVALWDAAECMSIERCMFSDGEGHGLYFKGGTPARSEWCSFFRNNGYGAACMGDGNFTFVGPSGDENGLALIGGGPAFGLPGSLVINIFGFKHETGTSGSFRPWKGTPLVRCEGWATVSIHGGRFAATMLTPYAFVHMNKGGNTSLANHTSSVQWDGVQFFGNAPRCILYDESKNLEYLFQRNVNGTWVDNAYVNPWESGHWNSGYGLKNDWVTAQTATGKGGPLQHLGLDGATDWATAKIYDPTGGGGTTPVPPNPVPCSYTTGPWSSWSTCAAGLQTRTRTVTSLPAGCSPTTTAPAAQETQTCSTAPLPILAVYSFTTGTAASITGTGGTMTRLRGTSTLTTSNGGRLTIPNTDAGKSCSYSCSWKGATVFTFTGLNWNGDMSYRLLCGVTDTDGQGRGIMVTPTGAVIDNRVSQGDKVIAPAGTVKPGTAVSFSVTVAPMDVSFFGAGPNAGNSWLGTLEELKVQ